MIDTYIFSLSKIAMGIFQPNYFASDRLLLELFSFESTHKIKIVDVTPSEDKSIISLALFFLRLSLYVVNGNKVPPIHRAMFVWSAALLLNSLSGVSEISKMNIVDEAVPFVFLVLIQDINKPGLDTIEVA